MMRTEEHVDGIRNFCIFQETQSVCVEYYDMSVSLYSICNRCCVRDSIAGKYKYYVRVYEHMINDRIFTVFFYLFIYLFTITPYKYSRTVENKTNFYSAASVRRVKL